MKRGFLNGPKAKSRVAPAGEAAYAAPSRDPIPVPSLASLSLDELKEESEPYITFPIGKVSKVELPEQPALTYQERDARSGSAPGTTTFTTIPIGAHPDEPVTECIFHEGSKEVIMAIPNFPRPMIHPKKVLFRMGPASGKGQGLFSKQAIKMGDLIFSERPLMLCTRVAPSGFTDPSYTREMIIQQGLIQLEQCYQIAFNRLRPADRAEFMSLTNCHTEDGSGPLVGRVRTNGLGISGLRPGVEGTLGRYSSVNKYISRLNHSCCANTYPLWDLNSFSFRVYASRDIAEGEELTFQYIGVLENTAGRQESLKPYSLVCTCPACTDPAASDPRRAAIKAFSPSLMAWAADGKLSDDWLINKCLEQLDLLTQEGLEHHNKYFYATKAIMEAYIGLGDTENASKWAAKVCRQVWADEYTDVPVGKMKPLMDPKNITAYKEHAFWRARVDPASNDSMKMFQMFAAMAGPNNIKNLDGGFSLMMFPGPPM
ncbi:ER lumen protein-retaining receptor [Favolaschia claudopus]|uniref:ER lumen protein-retaining receptor n=1 Tax=Favolaschia claudopus TaxID=2862362 RepID=A0AAW0ECM2_9AGAR